MSFFLGFMSPFSKSSNSSKSLFLLECLLYPGAGDLSVFLVNFLQDHKTKYFIDPDLLFTLRVGVYPPKSKSSEINNKITVHFCCGMFFFIY